VNVYIPYLCEIYVYIAYLSVSKYSLSHTAIHRDICIQSCVRCMYSFHICVRYMYTFHISLYRNIHCITQPYREIYVYIYLTQGRYRNVYITAIQRDICVHSCECACHQHALRSRYLLFETAIQQFIKTSDVCIYMHSDRNIYCLTQPYRERYVYIPIPTPTCVSLQRL